MKTQAAPELTREQTRALVKLAIYLGVFILVLVAIPTIIILLIASGLGGATPGTITIGIILYIILVRSARKSKA